MITIYWLLLFLSTKCNNYYNALYRRIFNTIWFSFVFQKLRFSRHNSISERTFFFLIFVTKSNFKNTELQVLGIFLFLKFSTNVAVTATQIYLNRSWKKYTYLYSSMNEKSCGCQKTTPNALIDWRINAIVFIKSWIYTLRTG